MSNPTALVQKLWNYCNILRDDGLSCGAAEVERRLSVVEELAAVVSANVQRATTSAGPFYNGHLQEIYECRINT